MKSIERNKSFLSKSLQQSLRALSLILVVSYPIAAHMSTVHVFPYAIWVLLMLFGVQAFALILEQKAGVASVYFLITIALFWLLQYQVVQPILLAAPVLMISGLLLLFAGTLLPDKTPLITRFAMLVESEPLAIEIARYTRKVTWLWVVVFGLLLLESVLLALLAPTWLWSLFTNGLNYLIVMLVLLIEFCWRMYFLPQTSIRSFSQFLTALIRIDWRRLSRTDGGDHAA